MSKWFTYSSKIEIPLRGSPDEAVEKMTSGLKKWLSENSGEDADRVRNKLYFAITPNRTQFGQFMGIDSGEITVEVLNSQLVVSYRLSYLSPFLPFLLLDLFLFGLSFLVPSHFEVLFFSYAVAFFLIIYGVLGVLTIIFFPESIREVWYSVNKSK